MDSIIELSLFAIGAFSLIFGLCRHDNVLIYLPACALGGVLMGTMIPLLLLHR